MGTIFCRDFLFWGRIPKLQTHEFTVLRVGCPPPPPIYLVVLSGLRIVQGWNGSPWWPPLWRWTMRLLHLRISLTVKVLHCMGIFFPASFCRRHSVTDKLPTSRWHFARRVHLVILASSTPLCSSSAYLVSCSCRSDHGRLARGPPRHAYSVCSIAAPAMGTIRGGYGDCHHAPDLAYAANCDRC